MDENNNNLMPPDIFMHYGRSMFHREGSTAQSDDRRFRSTFGTSPDICALLWSRVQQQGSQPSTNPQHLLWALRLLNLYLATATLVGLAGGVDERTFNKWAWRWVRALSQLVPRVISWNKRLHGGILLPNGGIIRVSIDGTDCRISEPNPFWTGWYSHKFKGPGVRYEVGLCIATGRIVWINGPYPCGAFPDLKIFCDRLKNLLLPGERVVADRGYRGDASVVVQRASPLLARHETANARLKDFNILALRFRHRVALHSDAFRAVAVIVELSLENGEPLFQVF